MAITLNGSTGIVEANIADNAITVNKIASDAVTTAKIATGAVSATDLASGAARANFGAGAILQVVQSFKTNTWSAGQVEWVDVTGLSATITPTSSSSKILVMLTINYCNTGGGSNGFRLMRDSTPIGIADAAGSRPRFSTCNLDGMPGGTTLMLTTTVEYLDSPNTTSSTTYKTQAFARYSGSLYVNYSATDRDNASYDARSVSSITLMEIAG